MHNRRHVHKAIADVILIIIVDALCSVARLLLALLGELLASHCPHSSRNPSCRKMPPRHLQGLFAVAGANFPDVQAHFVAGLGAPQDVLPEVADPAGSEELEMPPAQVFYGKVEDIGYEEGGFEDSLQHVDLYVGDDDWLDAVLKALQAIRRLPSGSWQ
jgi:hypothetical protein